MIKLKCVAALLLIGMLPMGLAAQNAELNPVAVAAVDGKQIAKIAPENTRVEFVGTHVGDDPKPRLGGFKKFDGKIALEEGTPVSVEVEFEIASIWTEFDNLTSHLMNADFFEADKFPKSTFKSNSIDNMGDGNCRIAGELTLHGTTGKVEFPAKFEMKEGGLVLTADFKIDRADFGMDKMTDGVEKAVSLKVVVGQATRGVESKGGHGGDSEEEASTESATMESVTVKVNLPEMTWSGCAASVRTRLKSVEKISEFEIDLDTKTATITYDKSFDLETSLNELAKVNNKMKDWSFADN